MKTYHISEFEWFVPTPKNKLGINFLRTDSFTLNAACILRRPTAAGAVTNGS